MVNLFHENRQYGRPYGGVYGGILLDSYPVSKCKLQSITMFSVCSTFLTMSKPLKNFHRVQSCMLNLCHAAVKPVGRKWPRRPVCMACIKAANEAKLGGGELSAA